MPADALAPKVASASADMVLIPKARIFRLQHQKSSSTESLKQCLKLMVAKSPLATKNWAGPVKFDPGQLKS